MPSRLRKTRKLRGHVSHGHGRMCKHRKHPGGRRNAGGIRHHRINFDKYHPGYFRKVGMRHYHFKRNQSFCPTVNLNKLWLLVRGTRKTSTPTSVTEQEQQMNEVDTLTLQPQMMTQERNELRGILANYTNKDLNNRLNFELEMVNMEHKKVMLDLQKFPKEIRETLYKCKELTEETVSYSILHNQLLSERTQLKEKVSMLREENRKLRREQISLQESCEKVKNLCDEAHEKIYELCAEERQRLDKFGLPLEMQKCSLSYKSTLPGAVIRTIDLSHSDRFENLQHDLELATVQDESLLQTDLLKQ
ncbi:hypothetical protein U0070_020061 [Myodes glareolus]|uniref:Disks large homolog 5 N-terminal domain-containing protein n=1 Tax=Myodes glareolus TaxID=447135 RepID=A0AAW0H557_MYOGA